MLRALLYLLVAAIGLGLGTIVGSIIKPAFDESTKHAEVAEVAEPPEAAVPPMHQTKLHGAPRRSIITQHLVTKEGLECVFAIDDFGKAGGLSCNWSMRNENADEVVNQ